MPDTRVLDETTFQAFSQPANDKQRASNWPGQLTVLAGQVSNPPMETGKSKKTSQINNQPDGNYKIQDDRVPCSEINPGSRYAESTPHKETIAACRRAPGPDHVRPESQNQSKNAWLPGGHRIHQWSLRFDSGANGLHADDFIFRVERQAQLYGVANRTLVIGIGDLLRDRAAQWFWTYQKQNKNATWEQLKSAFYVGIPQIESQTMT